MPDSLRATLDELAKLSPADRSAVLRRLSPDERKLLAQMSKPRPGPAAPIAAQKPAAPPCSPWLAKHLADLMNTRKDAPITVATQSALRELFGASP